MEGLSYWFPVQINIVQMFQSLDVPVGPAKPISLGRNRMITHKTIVVKRLSIP